MTDDAYGKKKKLKEVQEMIRKESVTISQNQPLKFSIPASLAKCRSD